MASIKRREDGVYRARYRDAAGKEHAKHFARKTDAQQWLDQVTASVVRGDYVDPKAGKVTFRSFATTWESIQVSSESTASIVDNALRLHILPELGDYPLAAIRPTRVQALIKKLEAKPLSAGTIKGVYHVLTQVFTAAVDDRLVAHSPCTKKIALPKGSDEDVVIPTVDEVAALVGAFEPRWQALAVTLAGSGLRIGELLGLQVSDVDFLRGVISVERQRTQRGDLRPPKSASSRRKVPVGKVVIDELAAHLAAYPSTGALFLDEAGEPLLYRRWRTLTEAAAKKAGVDVTAHTLRHFYASALIAGGASVKVVQERLGHYSPVITLETYSHLWPGEDDRTRDVMDAALSPLADSLRTRGA